MKANRAAPATVDEYIAGFPKDVQALAYMAKERGLEPRILNEVMNINYGRRKDVTKHVAGMLGGDLKGKTIGLFGLAFKPNTDDIRESPAMSISRRAVIDVGTNSVKLLVAEINGTEVRPIIEKCITLARRTIKQQDAAEEFGTGAERNSDAWKEWRKISFSL